MSYAVLPRGETQRVSSIYSGTDVDSTMTKDLKVGHVFARDLVDDEGNLVLTAGAPVDLKLIDRLSTRNCRQVKLASERDSASEALTRPYDSATARLLKTELEDTPSIVESWSKALASGEQVDLADIDHHVQMCQNVIESDPAAVVATALEQNFTNDSTSSHSLRLSYLAMATASLMNFQDSDIQSVARAGLCHDISLPADRRLLMKALMAAGPDDDLTIAYRKHPLRSAEMLKAGVTGFSQLEQILVAQVHEQCDGSGFPRGLKRHQLHPLSRLLNILDAFLVLIDPENPLGGYAPADALAYLILHTMYGSFDRDCVQALVTAAAVYPISTQVMLSDNSTATVFRSVGRDYLRPIVRLDDGTDKLVDLRRQASQIVGPAVTSMTRRLPKSKMNEVLWM